MGHPRIGREEQRRANRNERSGTKATRRLTSKRGFASSNLRFASGVCRGSRLPRRGYLSVPTVHTRRERWTGMQVRVGRLPFYGDRPSNLASIASKNGTRGRRAIYAIFVPFSKISEGGTEREVPYEKRGATLESLGIGNQASFSRLSVHVVELSGSMDQRPIVPHKLPSRSRPTFSA
jgi:hypothetical protein